MNKKQLNKGNEINEKITLLISSLNENKEDINILKLRIKNKEEFYIDINFVSVYISKEEVIDVLSKRIELQSEELKELKKEFKVV